MNYIKFSPYPIFILLIGCGNNTEKQFIATSNPDSLAVKNTYINQIDSSIYTTSGEFKKYEPENGVTKREGAIKEHQVILLTDENTLAATTDINVLAEFIKGIESIVNDELANLKDSGQLVLQFTLYSTQSPKIHISYNGSLKREDLNDVWERVTKHSEYTRTLKDSCSFQDIYNIN